MSRLSDEKTARVSCLLTNIAITVVLLGASVSLVGWALDWSLAKAILPGRVAMNPVSALAFLVLATTLGVLREPTRSLVYRRAAQATAGMVAILGIFKVASYLFDVSGGVDQWLFRDKLDGNEMAPNTAFCFALSGLALLLLDAQTRRGHRPALYLTLATALGAFVSLVGYAFGTRSMYGVASYIPMAMNTAILFQCLSLGLLAARPNLGVAAIVSNQGIGGMTARRLLVISFVVPILCGWLRLLGEQVGLYGTEFGVALMVAANAVIYVAVALWTGAALSRLDRQRQIADHDLRRLNEELERRVLERTAELNQANEALQTEIDEHRHARYELANTNRDLVHKNQENEMFVYSVSHDLRSPLVNLQGFSNELQEACTSLRAILATQPLPEEIRHTALSLIDNDATESVRFIQSAVMRLSNIIDALLRLSRVGRVEYQWQSVDTELIVQRIVDSMRATIDHQGAKILLSPLPKLWGDPTAIEQVFANLIGNSLKYLDPKRPSVIQVGCDETNPIPGRVTLYVKDNGLGIPENQREKAFQAFQRLHPNVAVGEGMGLAIVRRIVERHSGQIRIDNHEGPGTIIYVTLPTPSTNAATSRYVRGANLERTYDVESVASHCAG